MARKSPQPQQRLLDLPVSSPVNTHSLVHAPASANGDLSRTLSGISENSQIHEALLDAQHKKAVTGNALIGHMHQAAADVYSETITHHEELYQKGEGMYLKAYKDEYLTNDAKLLARHLYGVQEVAAHSMGRIMAQSTMPEKPPQPQPEQPKRLTVSQRVRGVYP